MKISDKDKAKVSFWSNNSQPQEMDFGTRLSNWLKSTQGILISIASILSSLALMTPHITSTKAPKNNILVEFSVRADSEEGYTYLYPETEKTADLEYTALNTWTAIPNETQEAGVSRGQINADGYPGFAANEQKPCRSEHTGALVVTRPSGACVAAGVSNKFNAKPGDKFIFKMNDNYRLYGDNKGVMNITLSRSNSKGK